MYDKLTTNKGADTGIIPLTDGEKKRILKHALESSAAMKTLTTDENVQKAFGHGNWSYSIYHNLVMTTAIEDNHSTKQVAKPNALWKQRMVPVPDVAIGAKTTSLDMIKAVAKTN